MTNAPVDPRLVEFVRQRRKATGPVDPKLVDFVRQRRAAKNSPVNVVGMPVLPGDADYERVQHENRVYQNTKEYGDPFEGSPGMIAKRFGEVVATGGKGVLPAAYDSTIGATARGLGRVAASVAEGTGLASKERADQTRAVMDTYAQNEARTAAQTPGGSVGSFVGPAALSAGMMLATRTPYAGALTGTGLGIYGLSSADQGMAEYRATRQQQGKDANPWEELAVGAGYGAAEILFERIGLNKTGAAIRSVGQNMADAVLRRDAKALAQIAMSTAESVGVNMTEEGATQYGQNIIDSTFDPNQDINEGVRSSMIGGGLQGLMFAGPGGALSGAYHGVRAARDAGRTAAAYGGAVVDAIRGPQADATQTPPAPVNSPTAQAAAARLRQQSAPSVTTTPVNPQPGAVPVTVTPTPVEESGPLIPPGQQPSEQDLADARAIITRDPSIVTQPSRFRAEYLAARKRRAQPARPFAYTDNPDLATVLGADQIGLTNIRTRRGDANAAQRAESGGSAPGAVAVRGPDVPAAPTPAVQDRAVPPADQGRGVESAAVEPAPASPVDRGVGKVVGDQRAEVRNQPGDVGVGGKYPVGSYVKLRSQGGTTVKQIARHADGVYWMTDGGMAAEKHIIGPADKPSGSALSAASEKPQPNSDLAKIVQKIDDGELDDLDLANEVEAYIGDNPNADLSQAIRDWRSALAEDRENGMRWGVRDEANTALADAVRRAATESPTPPPAPAQKQPWEMTRGEYLDWTRTNDFTTQRTLAEKEEASAAALIEKLEKEVGTSGKSLLGLSGSADGVSPQAFGLTQLASSLQEKQLFDKALSGMSKEFQQEYAAATHQYEIAHARVRTFEDLATARDMVRDYPDLATKPVPAEVLADYPELAPKTEADKPVGGFDSEKWNQDREARIKASKEAGNVHLDDRPLYVGDGPGSARGREIYNVHDPKERGTIRTVANTGDVVVYWSDKYSGDKNLATVKTEKQGRKTTSVLESWLAPTDLKDYVFAGGTTDPAPKPAQAPAASSAPRETGAPSIAFKTIAPKVVRDRLKAAGFKFNPETKAWDGPQTDDARTLVETLDRERTEYLANRGATKAASATTTTAKSEPQAAAPAVAKIPKNAANATKLRRVADATRTKGEESLNRDRNANTARRARMADSAVREAQNQIAMADLAAKVADDIEANPDSPLANIGSMVQLQELIDVTRSAKSEAWKDVPESERDQYRDRDKLMRSELLSVDNRVLNRVGEASLPWINGSNFRDFVDAVAALKGGKQAAAKLARYKTYDGTAVRVNGDLAAIIRDWGAKLGSYQARQTVDAAKEYFRRAAITGGDLDVGKLRDAVKRLAELRNQVPAAKENPVAKLERSLVGQTVGIDFFPTPPAIAADLVDRADIRPGMRVLEPSAGNGRIADAIKAAGVEPDVVEVSSSLREILEAKGHNLVAQDFTEFKPNEKYDRIVMNPPFSNRMDVEHVRRAYEMLNPGGRIVAIMSEGPFFGSDKKAAEFREWLGEVGESEKLPPNSFAQDRTGLPTTSVAARIVTIDKPKTAAAVAPTPPPANDAGAVARSELERVELIRKWGDRWQYRTRPGGTWYYSNSEAGAVESASKAYRDAPASERLTSQERAAKADANWYNEIHNRYKHLSLEQVRGIRDEAAGVRGRGADAEFTGRGTRRSGAAMANQGAREAAETARNLDRYIAERSAKEQDTPPEPAATAQAPTEAGVAERLDAIADRAKERLEKRAKKQRGSKTLNAGLNPEQLGTALRDTVDLSIVGAAKAAAAGVRAGRALTKVVDAAIAEMGRTVTPKVRAIIQKNVRKILAESGGDPDKFEKVVSDLYNAPVTKKDIRAQAKARKQAAASITNPGENAAPVSQADALRGRLKAAEQTGEKVAKSAAAKIVQATRQGYQRGRRDERRTAIANMQGVVNDIKRERGRLRSLAQFEKRAGEVAVKMTADDARRAQMIRDGIRKQVVQYARTLPKEVRGKLVGRIATADTPTKMIQTVRELQRELMRHDGREAWGWIKKNARSSAVDKLKGVTNDLRKSVADLYAKAASAKRRIDAAETLKDSSIALAELQNLQAEIGLHITTASAAFKAIKGQRQQSAFQIATTAADIIAKRFAKRSGDGVSQIRGPKRWRVRKHLDSYNDLRNMLAELEGDDGPLFVAIWESLEEGSAEYSTIRRDMRAEMERSYIRAGFKSMADAIDSLSAFAGRGVEKKYTVTVGGESKTLSLGEISSLIAHNSDPETAALIASEFGMRFTSPEGTGNEGVIPTPNEIKAMAAAIEKDYKLVQLVDDFKAILEKRAPQTLRTVGEITGIEPRRVEKRWTRSRDMEMVPGMEDKPVTTVDPSMVNVIRSFAENMGIYEHRTQTTGIPILLKDVHSVMEEEIHKQAATLALARRVRDAMLVLTQDQLGKAIINAKGVEFYRSLKRQVMAAGRTEVVYATQAEKAVGFLKGSAAVKYLAANPSTYIGNLLGTLRVLPDVDARYYAAGIAAMWSMSRAELEAKSGYLWDRWEQQGMGRFGPSHEATMDARLTQAHTGFRSFLREIGRQVRNSMKNAGRLDLGAGLTNLRLGSAAFMQGLNWVESRIAAFTWGAMDAKIRSEQPNLSDKARQKIVEKFVRREMRETQNGGDPVDAATIATQNRSSAASMVMFLLSDVMKVRNRVKRAFRQSKTYGSKVLAAEAVGALAKAYAVKYLWDSIAFGIAGALGDDDDKERIVARMNDWTKPLERASQDLFQIVMPIGGPDLMSLVDAVRGRYTEQARGGPVAMVAPLYDAGSAGLNAISVIAKSIENDDMNAEKIGLALAKFFDETASAFGLNPLSPWTRRVLREIVQTRKSEWW